MTSSAPLVGMTRIIPAVVRDGVVVAEQPLDLANGTPVRVDASRGRPVALRSALYRSPSSRMARQSWCCLPRMR